VIVVEGKRARGWLHRVSGCTAQREPLSAEVGVRIQEDDYDLSLLYAFSTCTKAPPPKTALAAEGRQAGWKQITNCDTSPSDTAARQAARRPYHARRLAATRMSAIFTAASRSSFSALPRVSKLSVY